MAIVSEPTRVTCDSSTLIDHIYSKCSENVNSLNIPKIWFSDHFPIFLDEKCVFNPQKLHKSYIEVLNFDEDKFTEDLKSVQWDTTKLFDNSFR